MSADIKIAKNKLSRMIWSGGFLRGMIPSLGNIGKEMFG